MNHLRSLTKLRFEISAQIPKIPSFPTSPVAMKLNRQIALKHRFSLACATVLLALMSFTSWAAKRPNIIIMMADDMGYSDIGPYGGEIQTPTLDALAKKGVRFTQFYNTARCCPTRATLLTGLYAHQAGIGHMMDDRGWEGYRGELGGNAVTIAQVLKTAGYRTYLSGKWHVTKHVDPEGPKYNWPLQRGFDRFHGTIHGAGSFYDPNSLTDGNQQIPPGDDFYYTDVISNKAASFVKDHKKSNADEPFFMYVAYTAPHWPMHALERDIKKYKGRYDKGWDQLREKRYKRMKKLGVIDESVKLSPRDSKSPAWDKAKNKEWELRLMEVYAAMVDSMDQGIGRIVDSLKETDQLDNTLILFLADNGGCAENMGRRGNFNARPTDPSALKPMDPKALQTNMIPQWTRDGYPVRQGTGVIAGPADTYLGYGLSWANASNTPFRQYKHWVHEGGISSPLIAHWPSGISKKQQNALYHQPAHLIDLMATCVDLAGAKYPNSFRGESITPMQGVSLAPSFSGKNLERSKPIFWEHEGNRAIRDGKWKLVSKYNQPWELYDISKDRAELNNLSKNQSKKAKELEKKYEAWAAASKVVAWEKVIPRKKKKK